MLNLKWIVQPLSAFAFGMLALLNLTLYLFWYTPGSENLNSATNQMGDSLVRSLAFDATTSLHSGNRAILSNILNRFADDKPIISATVSAEEGGIRLTSRTKNQPETGRTFHFPIHFSDELLGYAELELSEYDIKQWHSQAITSWILFNILSIAGLGSFIFWRTQRHEKRWNDITKQLAVQLPEIHQHLSGTPDQQFEMMLGLLNDPINKHGQLIKHLGQRHGTSDTERLLEQIELVGNTGTYGDVALVAIQCQNWEDLIRVYEATHLQQLWQDYEALMIRVGELYSGILLPDGFSLAFGINDSEEYAMDAVCAARVLQLSLNLIAQKHNQLSPVFGIAVSAGPAFISKTHKHGIPLPLVTGDADNWLAQIKALQPINQILLAEPLLQHKDVNTQVEASIVRDVTLRDGHRLEIWELERLKEKDDLLATQAETLVDTNKE